MNMELTEKLNAVFGFKEKISNEDLLYVYRLFHKEQMGSYSDWKEIEKEVLHRMER